MTCLKNKPKKMAEFIKNVDIQLKNMCNLTALMSCILSKLFWFAILFICGQSVMQQYRRRNLSVHLNGKIPNFTYLDSKDMHNLHYLALDISGKSQSLVKCVLWLSPPHRLVQSHLNKCNRLYWIGGATCKNVNAS